MPVLDFKMPPLGEAKGGHRPPPLEPKSVKYPATPTSLFNSITSDTPSSSCESVTVDTADTEILELIDSIDVPESSPTPTVNAQKTPSLVISKAKVDPAKFPVVKRSSSRLRAKTAAPDATDEAVIIDVLGDAIVLLTTRDTSVELMILIIHLTYNVFCGDIY